MESILKDLLRWSTWERKLRLLGFSPIPPPVSIISESDIVCAWVITTYDKTLENTDMSITRAPVSQRDKPGLLSNLRIYGFIL